MVGDIDNNKRVKEYIKRGLSTFEHQPAFVLCLHRCAAYELDKAVSHNEHQRYEVELVNVSSLGE